MQLARQMGHVMAGLLGSRSARPIAFGLARMGLRGLGLNLEHGLQGSGEALFAQRALAFLDNPVCADIGANIGEYALVLATAGAREVHAFEPGSQIYPLLEKAVAGNSRIKAHKLAVGESVGEISFYEAIDKADWVCSTRDASITSVGESAMRKVTVPQTTVDQFAAEHGLRFDFCKIDVEGFEMEVFAGMRQSIAAGWPKIIQFEFGPHNLHRRQSVPDFAKALQGYDLFRIARHSLVPLDLGHYLSTVYAFQNIAAVRKDLTGKFVY